MAETLINHTFSVKVHSFLSSIAYVGVVHRTNVFRDS